MELSWYHFAGIAIAVLCIYNLKLSPTSKASAKLAAKLSIKPRLVKTMIRMMGKSQGRMFVNHLNRWTEETIDDAIYTLFVFQILRFQTPQMVEWWQNRLIEKGYSIELTYAQTEVAFVYLAEFVTSIADHGQFLNDYRERYL